MSTTCWAMVQSRSPDKLQRHLDARLLDPQTQNPVPLPEKQHSTEAAPRHTRPWHVKTAERATVRMNSKNERPTDRKLLGLATFVSTDLSSSGTPVITRPSSFPAEQDDTTPATLHKAPPSGARPRLRPNDATPRHGSQITIKQHHSEASQIRAPRP